MNQLPRSSVLKEIPMKKNKKEKNEKEKKLKRNEYWKGSNNYLADFLQRSIEFGDGSGGPEKYSL